ncbi:MAG: hypothetical protein ACRCX8_05295 [Sarcina sp.]
MNRKQEIKRLEDRLRLLKSEEVLIDRILEDTVEVIERLKQGKFESNTKTNIKNKVRYRLQVIREGTTMICRITNESGTVLLGEGIAICHDEDEFDDRIGFAIAQFRAKADWTNRSTESFMRRMNIK